MGAVRENLSENFTNRLQRRSPRLEELAEFCRFFNLARRLLQ
jgi:hypothetical protein